MSEYTVEFDGKEYKFLSWNDAEAFIQQTADILEESGTDILEYQNMLREAKQMHYINLSKWITDCHN